MNQSTHRRVRVSTHVAAVLAALTFAACTDRQPSAPSTSLALDVASSTVWHAVEAKVQSAQCPVDGTTVTWVNLGTYERYFMEVVRNIATGEVPEGRYIVHWRPIPYSTVLADPDGLSRAPFRDGVPTQPTPLATNPYCVASIYTTNSNGNNGNRIPLTLDNYLLAIDQHTVTVANYTKLLPMSLSTPGATIRGRLRDEQGNPIGLSAARNVFRIEPWPDGVGPFGCAAGNTTSTPGRCRLLQGILESFGTVGTTGEFEFGANPDTENREWVLEMSVPGRAKGFFKPFRVSGGGPVDLDLFEEDRRAFLHYVTEDRDPATSPDLLAGTTGWTLVRDRTSDNYQVAHSWVTGGVGFFTLHLTTDPGTSKAKNYQIEAQCDGGGAELRMCTLLSAPRGMKVTVTGGGRNGEGTLIVTSTLSGVNEVCSHVTSHATRGGAAVDRAPDAGCVSAPRAAGDGNTWASPF